MSIPGSIPIADSRPTFAADLGKCALWVVWQCIRLPLFLFLLVLETSKSVGWHKFRVEGPGLLLDRLVLYSRCRCRLVQAFHPCPGILGRPTYPELRHHLTRSLGASRQSGLRRRNESGPLQPAVRHRTGCIRVGTRRLGVCCQCSAAEDPEIGRRQNSRTPPMRSPVSSSWTF